jgi:hypothetical protein
MVKFENQLDEFLTDVVLAQGLQRQIRRDAVKKYIASISPNQFRQEMTEIQHLPALEILNSLGVKKEYYNDFLQTITKARSLSGLK